MSPPCTIDDAKVFYWTWSGEEPFFYMTDTEGENPIAIHGFAICQYDGSGTVYRFSCDADWETVNDWTFDSMADAMDGVAEQYRLASICWQVRAPKPIS